LDLLGAVSESDSVLSDSGFDLCANIDRFNE